MNDELQKTVFAAFLHELGAIEKQAMEKEAIVGQMARGAWGAAKALKGAVAGGARTGGVRGALGGAQQWGRQAGKDISGAFARGAAGAPATAGGVQTVARGVGNVLRHTGAGNLAAAGGVGALGAGALGAGVKR
jgi:hypothetical protein